MIFDVSILSTRVLDPPTLSHQLDANCGKIWYVCVCVWVTLKTNRPNFCLIKLSHALDGLFSVLSRLHCCNHKCTFLLNEGSLNVTTFRYCCLGFFLAWDPLFIFRYRYCDGYFPCFGKYIFPQLQTCSADCTEGSCSSNIPSKF